MKQHCSSSDCNDAQNGMQYTFRKKLCELHMKRRKNIQNE